MGVFGSQKFFAVCVLAGCCLGGWFVGLGCGGPKEIQSNCGSSQALVSRVIDGDTVELQDGTRVRYLLVDTPEVTGGKNECFGEEAKNFNTQLVLDQVVGLRYDVQCEDIYGRLLAFVSVKGREVNRLILERGFGCVLHIPPNGLEDLEDYQGIEALAKKEGRGLWGACQENRCVP